MNEITERDTVRFAKVKAIIDGMTYEELKCAHMAYCKASRAKWSPEKKAAYAAANRAAKNKSLAKAKRQSAMLPVVNGELYLDT
mgnify:CR=1 FL=1